MLQVAGLGYAELLRMRIRQTSENAVNPKFAEFSFYEVG
jgi:hypothetical protein